MKEQDTAAYEYAREIIDGKLLCLRFLRKIYVIVIGTIVGAILFGGVYFLCRRLLPPEKEYEAGLSVYLEYYRGEEEPLGWVCFTQDAWKEFVVSDDFVSDVLEQLSQTVTKEEYLNSISSVLLPDGRVLSVTVTTPEPAKSVAIARAIVQAVDDFADTQERILWTRPLTVPDGASLKLVDDRTVNTAVLGAVVGFLLSGLFVLYRLTVDDSVYVPELFACRYRLPMIGTLSAPELKENFEAVYREQTPVIIFVDDAADDEKTEVVNALRAKTGCRELAMKDIREIMSDRNDNTEVLIAVKSGAHNGKRIQRMLQQLCIKGTKVCAAVLLDADESLLRAYYGPFQKSAKTAGKDA